MNFYMRPTEFHKNLCAHLDKRTTEISAVYDPIEGRLRKGEEIVQGMQNASFSFFANTTIFTILNTKQNDTSS